MCVKKSCLKLYFKKVLKSWLNYELFKDGDLAVLNTK